MSSYNYTQQHLVKCPNCFGDIIAHDEGRVYTYVCEKCKTEYQLGELR